MLAHEEYVFQISLQVQALSSLRDAHEDQDANLSKGSNLSLSILSFLGRSPCSRILASLFPVWLPAASRPFCLQESLLSGHGLVLKLSLAVHPAQCEALGPGAGIGVKGWGPYPQGAHNLLGARPGCRSQRHISTALGWMEGQGCPGNPSSGPEVAGPAVPWVAGGHVPLWSDLVTSPRGKWWE